MNYTLMATKIRETRNKQKAVLLNIAYILEETEEMIDQIEMNKQFFKKGTGS